MNRRSILRIFSKYYSSQQKFAEKALPLNFNTINELISSKKIHTVIMGFPDHYGRLMGKRFEANFFLDSVLKEGGHACNYLLSCDLFMNTPTEIVDWKSGLFE